MKSRWLRVLGVLAFVLGLAGLSHAQPGGTVTFANNSSSRVVFAKSGAPATPGDNVLAALYWSPLDSSALDRKSVV